MNNFFLKKSAPFNIIIIIIKNEKLAFFYLGATTAVERKIKLNYYHYYLLKLFRMESPRLDTCENNNVLTRVCCFGEYQGIGPTILSLRSSGVAGSWVWPSNGSTDPRRAHKIGKLFPAPGPSVHPCTVRLFCLDYLSSLVSAFNLVDLRNTILFLKKVEWQWLLGTCMF